MTGHCRWLEALGIEDLRCIESGQLTGLRRVIVLAGHNGAGKTTVLEAVAILSSGNSFQAGRAGALVRRGADSLTVRGTVAAPDGGQFAVMKTRTETFVRHNRTPVASAASLIRRNPSIVITPDVVELVRGGPAQRRQLMDRSLFHVEPAYVETFRGYHRAMVQRTVLLRAGQLKGPQIDYWEGVLEGLSAQLDQARTQAFEYLRGSISARGWPEGMPTVELHYRRGWSADQPLAAILRQSREGDAKVGKMHVGPHRAELAVVADGASARTTLSRGQARIVGMGLKLAQWSLIKEGTGLAPWLLVDDLGAELASDFRHWMCRALDATGAQVFVTVTDADLLLRYLPPDATTLFHVKQGVISRTTELDGGRG